MRFCTVLALALFCFQASLAAVSNPSTVGAASFNFSVTGELQIDGLVNDLDVELYVVPEACADPVYSYGTIESDEQGRYISHSYDSVSSDISWFELCNFGQQAEIPRYPGLRPFPEPEDSGMEQYTLFTNAVDYDEDIAATASEVTSGSPTNLEAVMRLASWVYSNMEYDLDYVGSLKSASWVFDNRRGVCAEYATLFMSLVRSLGFPVRYVSGWAYGNVYGSQFNSHAWTEVYLEGRWIPFDPTYGEFGYVDALHIPVSRTADGNESTIKTRWSGSSPGTVSIPSSLESDVSIADSSGFGDFLHFDAHLSRNQTGVDDHVLLTVNITNPTDDYVGVSIVIARTNSTEVVYGSERGYAVLPPKSSQEKYVIVHTTSCDRDYPYYCVNPFDIYIPGAGNFSANLNVKPWITETKTFNQVMMMVQEEEAMVETGLDIVEIGMEDVFYEDPEFNITVRNTGNSIVEGLSACVCYSGLRKDLELGRLLINGVASANATLDAPPSYGTYDAEIILESEHFNHTVERRFTYAQRPEVGIAYSGERTFSGFNPTNFMVVLDAERCENVSITLATPLNSQKVQQDAEMYNVTLPAEYFMPGNNTLTVFAHCTDPHNNVFDFSEEFHISRQVAGLDALLYRISSFFAWVFSTVTRLFTPV